MAVKREANDLDLYLSLAAHRLASENFACVLSEELGYFRRVIFDSKFLG